MSIPNYSVLIYYSEDERQWIARPDALPNLEGIEGFGETRIEALANLEGGIEMEEQSRLISAHMRN